MSENLSGGSGGENLVSPPPRQSWPATPPSQPAPPSRPVTAQPTPPEKKGPITGDDMVLDKIIKVGKAIKLKLTPGKKKD